MLGPGTAVNRGGFIYKPVTPDINQNNIAIAFSVARRVVDNYTGNALRIRVDTTGQPEHDIGFDSNGNLDVSAIATSSGSNNAYVVTLYDQSGNNKNASPDGNVAARQPQIYDGSDVIKINEKPAIKYTASEPYGGNGEHLSFDASSVSESDFSVFLAFKYDSGSNTQVALRFGSNVSSGYVGYGYITFFDPVPEGLDFSVISAYAGQLNDSYPYQDLGPRAFLANVMSITAGATSDRAKYFFNGSVLSTFPNIGTSALSSSSTLGAYSSSLYGLSLEGRISEMIMYGADKYDSASAIHADIKSFYSLY